MLRLVHIATVFWFVASVLVINQTEGVSFKVGASTLLESSKKHLARHAATARLSLIFF